MGALTTRLHPGYSIPVTSGDPAGMARRGKGGMMRNEALIRWVKALDYTRCIGHMLSSGMVKYSGDYFTPAGFKLLHPVNGVILDQAGGLIWKGAWVTWW